MNRDIIEKMPLGLISQFLTRYDFEYYVLNKPSVSDETYDTFCSIYKDRNHGKEWVRKAYDGQKIRPVRHIHPMGSVNRTYEDDDVIKFVKKISKDNRVHITYKYDGIAFTAYYEEGILKQVLTRGNGQEGEDVTDMVLYRNALPVTLNEHKTLAVKGEFYVHNSIYEMACDNEVNEGMTPFVGPRQLAGSLLGSVKLNWPLHAAIFRLLTPSDTEKKLRKSDILLNLTKLGLPTAKFITYRPEDHKDPIGRILSETTKIVSYAPGRNVLSDIPVDGLIIESETYEQEESLGGTWYKPGFMKAYKFPSHQVVATISETRYDITMHGVLVPKALFTPEVPVGNYTCRELSLYNAKVQKDRNLYPGKEVFVRLTGDTVLTIVSKPDAKEVPISIPKECPYCNDDVLVEKQNYFCVRGMECRGAITERLFRFFGPLGINLKGLGRELLGKFDLKNPSEFFHLSEEDIANIVNSQKIAKTIVDQFPIVKQAALSSIIMGLAIPDVGKESIRKDLDGSFNKAVEYYRQELLALRAVGFESLKERNLS